MNIAQYSRLTGRAQGLLAQMLTLAPIFQTAQFRLATSDSLHVKDSDNFTSSAARAENASAQKDAQKPITSILSLALYTRELEIDNLRKLDANVNQGGGALRLFADNRLAGLAVKMATEIQDDMLSGSGSSNKMLGLLNIVKDANAAGQTSVMGFTTAELAAMNTDVSLQLNTTANQDAFVETLYKEMSKVPGCNAILCNVNLAARMTSMGKRIGAAGETINEFGTQVKTFNGVPIVPLPTTSMGQAESDGTNSDCCSLIVTRFSEQLGLGFNTNSGFSFTDFENAESTPSGRARMEMFLQTALDRTDALRRLSRIRL